MASKTSSKSVLAKSTIPGALSSASSELEDTLTSWVKRLTWVGVRVGVEVNVVVGVKVKVEVGVDVEVTEGVSVMEAV